MKTLLIAILLVLVYQSEELGNGLLRLLSRIRKQKYRQILKDSDHYVGTALTIATMPLLLNYIVQMDAPLISRLFWLFAAYSLFGILAFGLHFFLKEMEHLKRYQGFTYAFALTHTVAGVFYPAFYQVPWSAGRERLTYAKLAFLLSIPALLGLGFKLVYDQYAYQELDKYFDVLTVVLVGALFIQIIIRFLENYFASHSIGVLSYFRVALGLAIAFLLIR